MGEMRWDEMESDQVVLPSWEEGKGNEYFTSTIRASASRAQSLKRKSACLVDENTLVEFAQEKTWDIARGRQEVKIRGFGFTILFLLLQSFDLGGNDSKIELKELHWSLRIMRNRFDFKQWSSFFWDRRWVSLLTLTLFLSLSLSLQNNPTPWNNVEPGTNTKMWKWEGCCFPSVSLDCFWLFPLPFALSLSLPLYRMSVNQQFEKQYRRDRL